MIVLHTVWSPGGRLCVWGEDAWLPPRAPARRGGRTGQAPARPRRHPFACPETVLPDALFTTGAEGAIERAEPTTLTLSLPSVPDAPVASPGLVREEEEGAPRRASAFLPWTVDALAFDAGAALDLLLLDPDDVIREDDGATVIWGDGFRYFAEVGRLALELAARGRILPVLAREGERDAAIWRPVVRAEADLERVELLRRTMPASCRAAGVTSRAAVDGLLAALVDAAARGALAGGALAGGALAGGARPAGARPPGPATGPRRGRRPARSASRALARPTAVEACAEAWLEALGVGEPVVVAETRALGRLRSVLEEWARPVVAEPTGGLRTCFRITAPGEEVAATGAAAQAAAPAPGVRSEVDTAAPAPGVRSEVDTAAPASGAGSAADASGPWRLDFLLQAADDPSLLVPAGEVWKARGGTLTVLRRRFDDPQERLLGDLGRALRLFPGLEPALRTPRPEGLDLDVAGAHHFLREAAPLLEQAGLGVLVPSWWKKPKVGLGVRLHARPKGADGGPGTGLLGLAGLCDYEWRIALGDEPLSLEEFRALARLKVPLVRVRGEWVELRREEVETALAFLEKGAAGQMTAAEALRVGLGIEPSGAGLPVVGFEAEGWLGPLLSGERIRSVPAPAGFRGTLRPYQKRGLAWLAFLDRVGLGACLADDMGLGKTIQLLALLVAEREEAAAHVDSTQSAAAGRIGRPAHVSPTLLVCPMSVVGNWQREAARFAPGLRVHVHHGGERASGEAFRAAVRERDVVLTTYALAARDREDLAAIEWGRIVLDEAQNIKNAAAQQTQAIRSLRAPRRIALTGTPVENRLSELWSIMEFLNPGLLGSANGFRTRFATPIERYRDEARATQLRRLTGPFILRRLKTDRRIISDLPEKVEMKVYCNLTREQATLYQAVVDDMLERIETTAGIERKGLVLATMLKLKQVCNHPAQLLQDRSTLEGRSGKLERLEETLEEVLAVGDRALVFTQFAEMGRLLHAHLRKRLGREVLFLHGGTARKDREEMVARFQAPDGPPVFLLSLKAGGTGLNLTAANQVIHFDRWWNPAVEDQATDRAFRIGQRRDVQVRKLVCTGTLEERIDAMIERKKDLADRIVGTGESWLTELSTAELRELLVLSADAVAE